MKRVSGAGSRWGGRWVLLLATVLLAGCSLVSLAYNRLPTLAYWRLDGMLDLDGPQSALVRQELDRWHGWHRREHLPRYAQALQRWQALALQDVTPAQVCEAAQQVRLWAQEAGQQVLPLAMRLAPTLTEAQLQHWQRHQAERDDEFRADFMAADGAVNPKRLQKAVERAEMFYGTLSAEQRAWWRERLQRSAFDPQRALEQRQRRFDDFTATVRRIQQGGGAQAEVQAAWDRVWQAATPAEAAADARVFNDGCAQLAELHNRTTPQQRQRAQQRLQAFAQDFLVLSAQ